MSNIPIKTNEPSYNAIPSDPESQGQDLSSSSRKATKRTKIIVSCIFGVIGAAVVSVAGIYYWRAPVHPRNVIMMVSDGFGPASETFARQYHTWDNGLPYKSILPLDSIHVGQSRTQSSSSLVTDSAAGATAFSCGLKSYNGAIGVDPEESPCGTVLESAKIHKNMLTGLVVTSRITHATPAAFSAHVAWRDWENDIALQQIGESPLGRTIDLMFGGGRCQFLTNQSEGGCRTDSRDLLSEAKTKFGWKTVLDSRKEFDTLTDDSELPLMGLYTPSHMSYDIDRDPTAEPSLAEMSHKALSILSKTSKKQNTGFFLMIEGSRIDMAAHTNDPAAHLHEINAYQDTIKVVKDFVDANPGTVVISTSDHETGGFTLGRQTTPEYPEYKWEPAVIKRVKRSAESLGRQLIAHTSAEADYVKNVILEQGLGITDATDKDIEYLENWQEKNLTSANIEEYLSNMVSVRALIGWTTHGHTAVDVNLYAYGPSSDKLRGTHENTDIGDFISEYLGLDLEEITRVLKR
ncbi:alkaline-phosphatase-like protein [Umbelopsis sp. PMI_123]|nr:alkaline-phosphatase-like protein [Umbelopsis sp. PMI_123]